MFRAAVGFSQAPDAEQAADAASAQALGRAGLARADGALVFATPHHERAAERLASATVRALGTRAVAGAVVARLHAGGREADRNAGVAILALGGVAARSALLLPEPGWERRIGEDLALRLERPPEARHLAVLLMDPAALAPAPFLAGLDADLPAATLVGGAAAAVGGHARVWSGSDLGAGGVAALLTHLPRTPRLAVHPGWWPLGPPRRITRADGHWVREIDGRPALDVYLEAAREPLARDLRRTARLVLVGVERTPGGQAIPMRNVAGFDAGRRAIALPEAPRSGERIGFALRDPIAARDALKEALERLASIPPAAVLHLGCDADEEGLLGIGGLEAAYLARAFGEHAVAGAAGSSQLVRRAGRTELLTHAGVVLAIDGSGGEAAPAHRLR